MVAVAVSLVAASSRVMSAPARAVSGTSDAAASDGASAPAGVAVRVVAALGPALVVDTPGAALAVTDGETATSGGMAPHKGVPGAACRVCSATVTDAGAVHSWDIHSAAPSIIGHGMIFSNAVNGRHSLRRGEQSLIAAL